MASVDFTREIIPVELSLPLRRLRRLIHRYVLLQGLVLSLCFAIGSFWVFGLCDYLPIKAGASESPRIARICMLAFFLLGTLYLLIRVGLARYMVRWPDSSLSLLIERRFPGLESALSTAILGSTRTTPKVDDAELASLSVAMHEESRQTALERMQGVNVDAVINWIPLRWQMACLGILFLGSVFAGASHPQWLLHWQERFFFLSDEPWPRNVRMTVEGMELDIPSFTGQTERERYVRPFRAYEATIAKGKGGVLRVLADRKAARIPEYCSIFYRSEDGTGGRANLRRLPRLNPDWEPFVLEGPPLEAMDQTLHFSVTAEDLKLPRHTIRLVDSPMVAEAQLEVVYPKYLQKTYPSGYFPEKLEYRNGQRILQGAGVTFSARGSKPLDKVDYVVAFAGENESRKVQSLELDGDSFHIPISNVDSATVNASLEVRLWDSEGLCADRIFSYVISVVPDEIPKLDLSLQGIGTAVTPNATLPIKAIARDDHGIQSSWLELVVNESKPVRLDTKPDREGNIETSIELEDLARSTGLPVQVNSTLSLTMAADDFFDLSGQKHVGRAAPIQLAVVTPDALLILLEKRELAMRVRLEQAISEMTQVRELINKMKGENPEPDASTDLPNTDASQQNAALRLRQLRSQQASSQSSKAASELRGIAREIGQIALELVHNKIDAKDRRERLELKVQQPIVNVIEGPFQRLQISLKEIEQTTVQTDPTAEQVQQAASANDQILADLREVLKNMIEIQDFNELLDMVRDLIDDQQKLLDATKKEQKKQVIDLFK